TDAGSRLGGLDDGERNLRAVFDECLTRLTHQQADLYRLLGLHPGPDISTLAVAALTDQPVDQITVLLRQLVQARLLTQNSQTRDRWSMHDLLRVHAQEQARITMGGGRVSRRRLEQARTRLTAHYIRRAEVANRHLDRVETHVSALFSSREHALAWFDAERENLLAIAHTDLNTHEETARLGFILGEYLQRRWRLQDLLTLSEYALNACQALGRTRNLAAAWNNFGSALGSFKRYGESIEAHQTSLHLYQQISDIRGEASSRDNLGKMLGSLKRYDESVESHQIALRLYRKIGNVRGQSDAWNNLGNTLGNLKRYDEALEAHQTSLRLEKQMGNTHSQAVSWNNVGTTFRALGRLTEAIAAAEKAVAMLTQEEDWGRAGEAWGELATTLSASGAKQSLIQEAWEQSAAAYTRIGDREAAATSLANAENCIA
ncbi:tetratricopeptide repeat protein, partial [Streptomyces sp. S1]|uniref:tetratricopeptide repeat protein n=1 Tax=Streptomyces sp. S1 TaxID=718288 RepID=UPI003D73549F